MGKKKKNIFSLIVIFLMAISMFPMSAFAEADGYAVESGQPAAEDGSYIADNGQGAAGDNDTDSQDVINTDGSAGSDDQQMPVADNNDADEQDQINLAGNFVSSNNIRSGNNNNKSGDYNHIDVRVAASLTLVTKVNGVVIKSETINVQTSNVSGTLNGENLRFYKKSGQGKENEWRSDGLNLDPRTDTVTINCTLSGRTSDGNIVNVTTSQTYTGLTVLWGFILNCPAHDGYDIDIAAKDISESFTVDKTVKKVWDDSDNPGQRPGSVQIQLYADGSAYGKPVTVNAQNKWEANFTGLPKYSTGTTEIKYTADEVAVPTGYTKSISADGLTITNKYVQQKTSVSVTKKWKDNGEETRPDDVTVQLYADGTAVEGKTLTLSRDSLWTGSFTDLPVYKDGKKIAYTVKENPVRGYTSAVTGTAEDGFTITNTYTPETMDISVIKEWKDGDNKDKIRPESIVVQLCINGDPINDMTLVLSDVNNWSGTFKDMPVYEGDEEINYTIMENEVDGYTTEIRGNAKDGFVITNSHTPKADPAPVAPTDKTDKTDKSAKTGDTTNVLLWAVMLAASACGLGGMLWFRRRNLQK